MQKTFTLKPTKRILFYPTRRGRLGHALRVAGGALLLGMIFIYGALAVSHQSQTLMGAIGGY